MSALLIAPHADDETLFASYLAQKHAAHIVVVYDEGQQRRAELAHATAWLGCTFQQLNAKKGMQSELVERHMAGVMTKTWDLVIAPAVALGGHEEHNLVGDLVERVLPPLVDGPRLLRYPTYAPRGERDRSGVEVLPEQPEWIARKLAALACYRSQISSPTTRAWFYELLDMREWVIE